MRDLRVALQLAHDVQAARTGEERRHRLLTGLRRLVPCDLIGYNEIDLGRGTAFGTFDPPDGALENVEARFLRVVRQHPLVQRQQAGDLSACAVSDFLTSFDFHRLELYQDFYRPMDVEDQLAFGLSGEVMIAIALCRSRRSFTDRDRQLLELVRPHLTVAYEQARERERDLMFITALETGLEKHHMGVIQLDRTGRLAHQTGAAEELLEVYLEHRSGNGRALPTRIVGWLDDNIGGRSRRELVIDGDWGRLRVREESRHPVDGWRTLLLEEQRVTAPSVEFLVELGLTRRQAQVLRLVAAGQRSREIGAELQISSATVEKHVEHIYTRLGVNSRAQALARVYGQR